MKKIIICFICMSYEIVFAYNISVPEKQVCPENYILIPALLPYVDNDFCVAKFEMKNDGMGIPVSHAKDEPWANIDRSTAQSKCKMLGASYDLISNDQWQAMSNCFVDNRRWSAARRTHNLSNEMVAVGLMTTSRINLP